MRYLMFLVICVVFGLRTEGQPEIKFDGLKIFVANLSLAEDFYQRIIGLEVISRGERKIELKSNTWPIILELAEDKTVQGYPEHSRTGLSFQTYKLLPRIDNFRKLGVILFDSLLSRNGVGISIPFQDPFGNVLNIMEVQIREVEQFDALRIYNSGVTIHDMESAMDFYEGVLGFEEWSRNYLPAALPLKHHDGSFAFMIHHKNGLKKNFSVYGQNSQIVLMMTASDLGLLKSLFEKEKIEFQMMNGSIVCRDPEGNYIEISESR